MTIIYAALFITLMLGLLAFAGYTFYSGVHQAIIHREINRARQEYQSMGIA